MSGTADGGGGGSSSSSSRAVASSLFCGGASAAMSKSLFAPLERVKLILQNQRMSDLRAHQGLYKGALDALWRLPQEQGFASFWWGNGSNVARIFPTDALRFTLFDHIRDFVTPAQQRGMIDRGELSWGRQMLAGSLSGGVACALVYPLDIARTRLSLDQAQGGERTYKGILDCWAKSARRQGIGALYRGLTVSLAEIMPYTGIKLSSYSVLKQRFRFSSASATAALHFVYGWLASLTASLVCYPLDTIRRRIMLSGSEGFTQTYAGVVDCTVTIWRAEGGVRGFYPGCLVHTARTAPAAGLALLLNDHLRLLLA